MTLMENSTDYSSRRSVQYDKPSQTLKLNTASISTSTFNFGAHSVKSLTTGQTATIAIAVKQGFSGLLKYAFSSKWTKTKLVVDQKSQTFYLLKADLPKINSVLNSVAGSALKPSKTDEPYKPLTGKVASSPTDVKLTSLDQEIKVLRRLQFKIDNPTIKWTESNIKQMSQSYGKDAKAQLSKMNKQWTIDENLKNVSKDTIDKVTKEVFGSPCSLDEALNKLDRSSVEKIAQVMHQKVQEFEKISYESSPAKPSNPKKKKVSFRESPEIAKAASIVTLETIGVFLNKNLSAGGKNTDWKKFEENKANFREIVVDSVANEMSKKMTPGSAKKFILECKNLGKANKIEWNSLDDLRNNDKLKKLQDRYILESQKNESRHGLVSDVKKDDNEVAGESSSSLERTADKLLVSFQKLEKLKPK